MYKELPKNIYPLKHAEDNLRLIGKLPTNNMSRLGDITCSKRNAKVSVDIIFDIDGENIPYLQGKFTASLKFICERCTNVMSLTIIAKCLLAIIKNEHRINALPKKYEPCLISGNEPIELSPMVEDELILSLPLVLKHSFDCLSIDAWNSSAGSKTEELVNFTSPFAELSELKPKD